MNYERFFLSRCGSLGKEWDKVKTVHVFFISHVIFSPREDRTDVMAQDVDSGRRTLLYSFPMNVVCVFEEEPL